MTDAGTEVRADGSVEPHVGGVLLPEQFEDRPYSALHFLIGVENDFVVVEYETRGKRNSPFCAY